MAIAMPTYRFSADEYERMIEAGVFAEDARVELIRGEIVHMSPIGGPHNSCLNRINRSASRQVGDEVYVQIQGPIRLPGHGEPQPDLAIVQTGYDESKPPTLEFVLLVGEVADTSLEYDRGVKLPLYAEAGIPEAWLFDLVAHRIERHTDPAPGGYQAVAYAAAGQGLPSTVLPELTFDAAELLGLGRR